MTMCIQAGLIFHVSFIIEIKIGTFSVYISIAQVFPNPGIFSGRDSRSRDFKFRSGLPTLTTLNTRI